MKRKPKMRTAKCCVNCVHMIHDARRGSFCGLHHFFVNWNDCPDMSETCTDFIARDVPCEGFQIIREWDPDAGNQFCRNCKWYKGHEDRGGVCMRNPPEIFPHYNTQGKYVETRYERPEVNWDDYCSRWEKEED